MEVLVSNEREKEIMEQLIFFLVDEDEEYRFKEHEIEFIQKGLSEATIKVDKSVWDILMDSDNLTGVCKYCGEEWQGIEGISSLDIEEYESFLNLDKDESYHDECLRDNQCVNCSSTDSDTVITDIGALYESCYKDGLEDEE